jgi:hypothetical protein
MFLQAQNMVSLIDFSTCKIKLYWITIIIINNNCQHNYKNVHLDNRSILLIPPVN